MKRLQQLARQFAAFQEKNGEPIHAHYVSAGAFAILREQARLEADVSEIKLNGVPIRILHIVNRLEG